MKTKSGDIIIIDESLHKSSLSSTSLNDLKVVRIRILAPSGDHFELGMAPTTTISEFKTEIFNSWPKGIMKLCPFQLILGIYRANTRGEAGEP